MKHSYKSVLCVLALVGLVAGLAVARDYRTGTRDLVTTHEGDGNAYLGVFTQEVDRSLMRELKLTTKDGAVITDVIDDSPADKAGFEEDDVIIEANGAKIESSEDLEDAVDALNPGDKLTLTVLRDGKEMQISATLGDDRDAKHTITIRNDRGSYSIVRGPKAPKAPKAAKAPRAPHAPDAPDAPRVYSYSYGGFGSGSYIGVQLTELNRQLGEYFGVTKGQGVLVNEVEKDSPAEKAGIKAGDVIVTIDNDKVNDISDAQEIIQDHEEGEKVSVSIIRDRKPMTLTVEVEEQSGWSGSHSWSNTIVVPPVPPVPAAPKIKIRSHSKDARELYFDQAELEEDLAELREDLSGLSEELSSELAKEYNELSKSEVRKLKRELERLNRDAKRLH